MPASMAAVWSFDVNWGTSTDTPDFTGTHLLNMWVCKREKVQIFGFSQRLRLIKYENNGVFFREFCRNTGFYIYMLSASRLGVCSCFYWCGKQLSEWILHQHHKEVKFDGLPLNICYVRLNWHSHALTPGRGVTYPVRRRTLACWWLLRITALSHWWIAWCPSLESSPSPRASFSEA